MAEYSINTETGEYEPPFEIGDYVTSRSISGISACIVDWYKTERIYGFIDWDSRSDWESGFVEEHREEIVDKTRAIIVMVGDDRELVEYTDQLKKIEEDDFCGSCGQIGCGHG